ncbi:hypothetical protein BV898_06348 [Hypsibius exemplaris]|uniref:Polyglutamine-binding protein 1 n=1 Tax=Hypsibius exemplaris TaxID=2072580 RepID=A0A1W0WWJ8_HYPEX|nr:hypothetical protein BV898_06348 [Hypsibius exemplaris]
MPLPPALQARLQKRGILTESGTSSATSGFVVPASPNTFASPAVGISQQYAATHELDAKSSWPGCPNKCNPFHVCVDYCRQRWGMGYAEPEKYTEKKRQLMLLKYPKPPGWKEIYDPGTGRHYYWNVETDEVSWFPPEHPKANVTVSANKLRAILAKTNARATPEVAKYLYKNVPHVTTLINEFSNEVPESTLVPHSQEHDPIRERFERQYGGVQHGARGGATGGKMGRYRPDREKEALDPMDPSAYSEVPRGGWGVGLETGGGEAKTGVDSTASGPLFQSRPYPSPGAILRRNAGIPDKKKK